MFQRQWTRSKDSWLGSGTNQGWKTWREEMLSQPTVTVPWVIEYLSQRIRVSRTMPIKPQSSHLYESPSLRGPGTVLTVVISRSGSEPTMIEADVPIPSLYDPSLTAMQVPLEIWIAMCCPLSGAWMWSIAHLCNGGSWLMWSCRVCGGAVGGGTWWSPWSIR